MTGLEFRKIRKMLQMSQGEMAKKIGLTQAQISRIEKTQDNIKGTTSLAIKNIFEEFKKQQKVEYIPTIKYSPDANTPNESLPEFQSENLHIPIYDVSASAGSGLINDENIVDMLVIDKHFLKRMFALTSVLGLSIIQVRGDSMMPTISPFSYLLVQKTTPKDGEICIVRVGDELFAKRLQKLPNPVLFSDNPKYEPIHLKGLDYEIIGSVVGSFQRL